MRTVPSCSMAIHSEGVGVTTGDVAQSTGGRVSSGRTAPKCKPDDECTGTRDEAAAAEVQQRFLLPTV